MTQIDFLMHYDLWNTFNIYVIVSSEFLYKIKNKYLYVGNVYIKRKIQFEDITPRSQKLIRKVTCDSQYCSCGVLCHNSQDLENVIALYILKLNGNLLISHKFAKIFKSSYIRNRVVSLQFLIRWNNFIKSLANRNFLNLNNLNK